jgi:aryl-alcohol dehydrogenase-like predicted oxidoreductase
MAKKVDPKTMAALRDDARRVEKQADSREAYPKGTRITRPNLPSRLFNVRLSEEQYAALQKLAREKHLPMSTMARAWLLDRLDQELHAS